MQDERLLTRRAYLGGKRPATGADPDISARQDLVGIERNKQSRQTVQPSTRGLDLGSDERQ